MKISSSNSRFHSQRLLILTGFALLWNLSIGASAFAEKGWLLLQEDRLGGPRSVFVSEKGLRIESKADSSVIVSTGPGWTVSTYSEQKKVFFECPGDKFVNALSKPIAVFYGVNLVPLLLKAVSTGTNYGVAITKYESSAPYDEKFWNRRLTDKDARRLPSEASAVTTSAIKIAPQAISVMLRLYNIPKLAGVPLVFSYKDQDKDFHWYLRTYSIKPVDIPAKSFQVPAGYRRVPTVTDVYRKAETEDVLKNLF